MSLFDHVEMLQRDRSWGRFLDAGTGVNSSLWSTGLTTESWTGVTAAPGHADQVRKVVGARFRPQDRLVLGNWTDPNLLQGEVHDTIVADYLIGAVEGFAPYFQQSLLRRLRPMTGRRLYVIGLDPYVVGPAETDEARMVRRIGRFRDAVLMLADETPYREYPAEWALNALAGGGFKILSARRFPNRYKAKWVNGQLDMTLRRLPHLADQTLAQNFRETAEVIRKQALELCEARRGLRHGADYVIACEPVT